MGKRTKKELDLYQQIVPPNGFGYRIKLLSQLISRRFQDALDPYGITPLQFVVIALLWEEDGLPTSAITKRLQQLGGTMTGVLDGLERRGLIRRQRDEIDRRVYKIWLTESGEKLTEQLMPTAVEFRKGLLSFLSKEEEEIFTRLVDKMIQDLAD